LTAADYSTGEYFHYTYDEVGNRLTKETHLGTSTYLYDAANRLIEVDGAPLAWDANGNLLDDGVSTYTYDHANRLTGVVQSSATYTFNYNGLGDRLQQIANGTPTRYSLDLNTGLTHVLEDGTSTYLYGVGRIGEEQLGDWKYHLPDALASLRQMIDVGGAISLTRSYQPYGEVLLSTGSETTKYGFTGEWTDATGLIHLRARYYEPGNGRFINNDPWTGDTQQPMSYNNWLYAYANPVNLTDPSGERPHIPPPPPGIRPPLDFPPLPPPLCSPYSPTDGECIPIFCRTDFLPLACPDVLTSEPGTSAGKGKLFVDLLKQCPGWWHEEYNLNYELAAVRVALVLAYYWESISHILNQPAELHEAMGEAYAHKYWQLVRGSSGFPEGAYGLIGGRESVRRRLETYIPLDARTDINVPSGHTTFRAVLNIWDKYSHQPGGDRRYRHRPYEWGNPSAGFRPELIGLKQGVCPKRVYYVSGGKRVVANDLCVVTFHQEKCIYGDWVGGALCRTDCEAYKSWYYPGE
jgi:RHS repeat-associated protein